MPRVLVIPGAAVRRYLEPDMREVCRRGPEVELLPAPGQPGACPELRRYGIDLAQRLATGPPVDALVGLSVGCQAAAVAAAATDPGVLPRLVLVGPTVDPQARTPPRLFARWVNAGRHEHSALLAEQLPDWRAAGVRRIVQVTRSALSVRLEQVLLGVRAELTVVHPEQDGVSSHAYAAGLATAFGGRLIVVPAATHSWPYRDGTRFAALLREVLE